MKRCYDRTLPEIAEYFGDQRFCNRELDGRVLKSKMTEEMKFKDRIEETASIIQLQP
jgi:hypothetical protein